MKYFESMPKRSYIWLNWVTTFLVYSIREPIAHQIAKHFQQLHWNLNECVEYKKMPATTLSNSCIVSGKKITQGHFKLQIYGLVKIYYHIECLS